ncbi:LysR substrate-binding domain-containing protein [Microbacterium sp. MAHUQ-60]|uniref:LysR substrate-binding domain-containing protein n=1 Tax=unclassified Microbacterium TaxID=2609290 RepID=UPI00360B638D
MFTLLQLESFIAVAEELHFGRAAERLRMTQPPLSRQIQQLERNLDVTLFVRTSRRVVLTPAGSVLLPRARRIVDLAAQTVADVAAAADGRAGTITIGYTAMAGQVILPPLLRLCREALPDVTFLLRELVTRAQVSELENGGIDIAILRSAEDTYDFSTRLIIEEPLVAALPAMWDEAQQPDPVSLSALAARPLLMYSPGESAYFYDVVSAMFREAAATPRVTQYAGQVLALLGLASAGMGYALVPASARSTALPGVAYRPVHQNSSRYDVRLHAAWRTVEHNPIVQTVVGLLDALPAFDDQ